MLEVSSSDNLIVGLRRSTRVIELGQAEKAFVAEDIAPPLFNSIVAMLKNNNIEFETVSSKSALGKACHIDVDASIVVIKKA